jgi:hypothetical protein
VERDIVVGQSNERMAEIKEGLREGDEVVLNPKTLVGDNAKTRQPGAEKKGEPQLPGGGGKEQPKGQDKKLTGNKDAGPAGFANMTPEEREKRQKEMLDKYRAATPEQRKQMLEKEPEDRRDKIKDRLNAAGITVE